MRTGWRGTSAGLVLAVATLTGSAVTNASTTGRREAVRATSSVSTACTRHVGESYSVSDGGQSGPVTLVRGRTLRLRFFGSDGFRWSRPTSTEPAAVGVVSVVRCPHHAVVAVVRARQPGKTTLEATNTPTAPDPPTFDWQLPVTVAAHLNPPAPVPELAEKLNGGGVLAYPPRLLLDGAGYRFTVPHVSCLAGRTARATIGMSGIKRTTTRTRSKRLVAWTAGLTISCTGTRHPKYTVGFTSPRKTPVHERLPSGDIVMIDTSGGECPSLGVAWSAPHSDHAEEIGVGCANGPGLRNHVQTLPVLLFGAHMRGKFARPVRTVLRGLSVNDTPPRLLPHIFRTQTTKTGPVVNVRRAPNNWYRFILTIR
jgi:hypothetical protein